MQYPKGDALDFGSSVWDSPTDEIPLPTAPTTLSLPPRNSLFGGFGDVPSNDSNNEDDGDDDEFGDFGDGDGAPGSSGFEEGAFGQEIPTPGPPPTEVEWEPLKLHPMPSPSELHKRVNDILGPIWSNDDEEILQVTVERGAENILATPGSRAVYKTVTQSPPPIKPPNWTRSQIRREHLIALGIPVNLDEVLPQANGKALPPLQITTRPMSAPPGPQPALASAHVSTNGSRGASPSASSSRTGPSAAQLGLGPKPQLDMTTITELLSVDPAELSLKPLPVLEKHLADLRAQTANTSALLSHLLQTREALQHDAETYNGLIAELVNEAQKIKTGKGRPISKRGSVT